MVAAAPRITPPGRRSTRVSTLALVSIALLLYTWLGYPLVMWALGALLGGRRAGSAAAPPDDALISVVIATRDDDAVIRDRVADVLATDLAPDRIEVIVALDAGRPSQEVALPLAGGTRTRIVRGDDPGGKAAALNAGMRAAAGAVVVFTDARQRFDADTISRLAARLEESGRLGAVSGALHIRGEGNRFSATNWYWLMERWLRRNEALVHSPVGVTGAVYAMRRPLWSALPPGLILDDLYVPMRLVLAGHRIGFEDRARAHDARVFSPGDEYRRKARTLTGVLQLCAWLPAVLVPIRDPIWGQFVSHKLLRFATPYLVIAAVIGGAAWIGPLVTPRMATAIVAGLALLALALMASRRLRDAVLGVLYMQAAILKAILNALRGEWNVWTP